jgi:hypothetical protein
MSWVNPTTVAPNDTLSASRWNQDVVANTEELHDTMGLVLITSQALSGASVQINDCFSADYDVYAVDLWTTLSTPAGLQLRLSVGGTPANGSDYVRANVNWSGATVSAAAATSAFIGPFVGSASRLVYQAKFFTPFAARQTMIQGFSRDSSPNSRAEFVEHDLATSYDGLNVFTTGGTFSSGRISIYGANQ